MEFEGQIFPTAEHAYQNIKPRRRVVRDWMLAAPTPGLLAAVAHALPYYEITPGWSSGRYARMQLVVAAKFRQHPDLAEVLLGTGDARLVETGTTDNEVNRRWGEVRAGGAWVGTNHLGLILMEVREAMRKGGGV
jgi:ribA/ribD-fused uncharacterized protein